MGTSVTCHTAIVEPHLREGEGGKMEREGSGECVSRSHTNNHLEDHNTIGNHMCDHVHT